MSIVHALATHMSAHNPLLSEAGIIERLDVTAFSTFEAIRPTVHYPAGKAMTGDCDSLSVPRIGISVELCLDTFMTSVRMRFGSCLPRKVSVRGDT